MTLEQRQRDRHRLLQHCRALQVGDALRIDGRRLREAFPQHPLTGMPSEEAFLESLPGVNYGAWRLVYDYANDSYLVSRHRPGETRVREDWDRRESPPTV